MNVDGHTACLASATVVIEIPKSGHTMTIQMTDRGDGQIYGAVVAEHKLPKGVLCKHCDNSPRLTPHAIRRTHPRCDSRASETLSCKATQTFASHYRLAHTHACGLFVIDVYRTQHTPKHTITFSIAAPQAE